MVDEEVQDIANKLLTLDSIVYAKSPTGRSCILGRRAETGTTIIFEPGAEKLRKWKRFWRAAHATLSGRAIDDLKQHLDRRLVTADEIAAIAQFVAIQATNIQRSADTAMITSLPPDDSGVASFSVRVPGRGVGGEAAAFVGGRP